MSDRTAGRLSAAFRRALLRLLSYPVFSRIFGGFAEIRRPRFFVRFAIRRFVRMFDIDLTEVEQPVASYDTLGTFFVRTLKPGARTVHPEDDALVSPVDAAVLAVGVIDDQGLALQIKGRTYPAADLIATDIDPESLVNGRYLQLYLSPRDYHRIHHPADGRIVRAIHQPGRLYPVNHFSLNHFDRVLTRNDRIFLEMDCEGRTLYLSLVGALNVGRIGLTASSFETNRGMNMTEIPISDDRATKGAELGWFRMGSTVVLLAPPDTLTFTVEAGQRVKMGEAIGRWQTVSAT